MWSGKSMALNPQYIDISKMSKPVSTVMETIALPAMVVSLIIPLLFSHSIEMSGTEPMCTHIYCMLEPWEFIYYTRGRRENIRESCRIYQSINCINNTFPHDEPSERFCCGLKVTNSQCI